MQFTTAEVGAGMTERWYGFLMQFTTAKVGAGMTDDWSFRDPMDFAF